MTQPQPAPSQHHPAVKSETMTERKRCLALIDKDIKSWPKLERNAINQIRQRIESGEQP